MQLGETAARIESRERVCTSLGMEAAKSNVSLWSVLALASGASGRYAGNDPHPRPVPEWGFSGSRRRLITDERRFRELWGEPDVVAFGFASDRYRFGVHEAITVPVADLWWLATPGDSIFLTDRVVHHCCEIAAVDREADRIQFSDPWPEQFFLNPGMNEAGVEAEKLSISRAEFERVTYGIVTLDTPDVIRQYLRARPEQRGKAGFLLRAGLALLDDGKERLAREAAPYLRLALEVAQGAGDEELSGAAASYLYLCLTIAYHRTAAKASVSCARGVYEAERRWLVQRFGLEPLHAGLRAEDLARAGYAAGNAKAFDEAGPLFSAAIARDAGHERAHFYRASVAINTGDFAAAVPDLGVALASNQRELEAARADLAAKDPRDRIGIDEQKNRKRLAVERRRDALGARAGALLELGDAAAARADADELLELEGGEVLGWIVRGEIAEYAGERDDASAAYGRARDAETDPDRRAQLQARMDQLAAQGVDHDG